jgi:excisionase family DNA binding protein
MVDEWLTTNEVASLLKVNPETVKRWLRRGLMRGSLLSDRAGWRIARTEVERFMAARSNAGGEPGASPPTRVS